MVIPIDLYVIWEYQSTSWAFRFDLYVRKYELYDWESERPTRERERERAGGTATAETETTHMERKGSDSEKMWVVRIDFQCLRFAQC